MICFVYLEKILIFVRQTNRDMKRDYTEQALELSKDIQITKDELYLIEMKGETLPQMVESFIWLYNMEDETCDLLGYVNRHIQKEVQWLKKIVEKPL